MSDKKGRAVETKAARIAELELFLGRILNKITEYSERDETMGRAVFDGGGVMDILNEWGGK